MPSCEKAKPVATELSFIRMSKPLATNWLLSVFAWDVADINGCFDLTGASSTAIATI